MRSKVRSYFVKVLDGYVERFNNTGWKEQELEHLKQELEMDLSRFSATPSARLSHPSFKSDRAFPGQC